MRWGHDKCQVIKIGKHDANTKREWKLGDTPISEGYEYRYLGDIITGDGKNKANIEARKNKVNASTITINTIASGEILNKMETSVLIELREKVNVAGLLTNAEAWVLNKSELNELEKVETQSIKHLFDLPIHIPTVALIYSFGSLYTSQRIEQQ